MQKTNDSKRFLPIGNSRAILLNKADIGQYNPIFVNVCECVGAVMELTGDKLNDKFIAYHCFINDSASSFRDKIASHLINSQDVKRIHIFGGGDNGDRVKFNSGTFQVLQQSNDQNLISAGLYNKIKVLNAIKMGIRCDNDDEFKAKISEHSFALGDNIAITHDTQNNDVTFKKTIFTKNIGSCGANSTHSKSCLGNSFKKYRYTPQGLSKYNAQITAHNVANIVDGKKRSNSIKILKRKQIEQEGIMKQYNSIL